MASSAQQQELLRQFQDIASCSEDKAHFFLSSHKWDLEASLASYMEMNEEADEASMAVEGNDAGAASGASNSLGGGGSSQASRSRNIASLRDIMNSQAEESSDEEDQSFYAGGEKSGIMMKGGPKKPAATDVVKNILEMAAKSRPAEESDEEDEPTVAAKPQVFTGAGYRLGSEDQPPSTAAQVPGSFPSAPEPAVSPSAPTRLETATRHLTFWRNGFTIEDGPLMSYDDPQNQEFLQAIRTGRAPTKMLNVEFGQSVEVKVMQKLEEDYKEPPKVLKPFAGEGHKLGGVMSDSGATPAPAPVVNPSFKLAVDNTQPVTTLQIRLADGTRLVAKFNHTHTVGDVRSFVAASTPGGVSRPFQLATTFPNRVLVDDSETIASAGLLNAVVLQRV